MHMWHCVFIISLITVVITWFPAQQLHPDKIKIESLSHEHLSEEFAVETWTKQMKPNKWSAIITSTIVKNIEKPYYWWYNRRRTLFWYWPHHWLHSIQRYTPSVCLICRFRRQSRSWGKSNLVPLNAAHLQRRATSTCLWQSDWDREKRRRHLLNRFCTPTRDKTGRSNRSRIWENQPCCSCKAV